MVIVIGAGPPEDSEHAEGLVAACGSAVVWPPAGSCASIRASAYWVVVEWAIQLSAMPASCARRGATFSVRAWVESGEQGEKPATDMSDSIVIGIFIAVSLIRAVLPQSNAA